VSEGREYTRFGPYVIVRTSGAGGMGRVQLALRADSTMADVCVIKRMISAGDVPDQASRFRREAQIAARLSHPNIARTVRVEEIDGELCIAQEYIQGMDLGRLMRQLLSRPIPVPLAAFVAQEVAAGLAYAHAFAGDEIVHRDVSPENVMISFDGDVKLIDFGIARSAVDGTLTNVGAVIGRREYIAPECWDGAKADRRVDVYALGVVLWEALTGRRVEEMRELGPLKALANPRDVNASIPEALAQVVTRALAAAPAERYQSGDELAVALAPFAATGPAAKKELAELLAFNFNVAMYREVIADDIAGARRLVEPRPRSSGTRSRWPWLAAAAGIVLVATAGVALSGRRAPGIPGSPTPVSHAAPQPSSPQPPPPVVLPVHANVVAPRSSDETAHHPSLSRVTVPRRQGSSVADVPSVASTHGNASELLTAAQESWDRGNTPRAIALAKNAIAAGSGAAGHLLLGAILLSSNKREAERELAEAVRLDPQNRQAKNLLALAQQKIAEGE
jgi:eukaryotic-like serine/threonine-protein kinase